MESLGKNLLKDWGLVCRKTVKLMKKYQKCQFTGHWKSPDECKNFKQYQHLIWLGRQKIKEEKSDTK